MAVIIASAQFSMRKQLGFDPLTKDTDIDVYADYCMSDLHEAIWEDDLEDVQKMLSDEHDASEIKKLLRKQDKDRRTPLVYALIRRNTPITKLLIAKKANINFANPEEGWTPLMYAIFHGHREGVDLLLEAGADPNAESTNKRPVTPLLLACGLGDTPAVAKLLKRGANMSLMYNAMGDYFFNPLMVAIHSTDIPEKLTRMALAELLINEGVDIQRPRSDGITPLMACMDKCMFETAKELIEHAARCDKEVDGYITAMYMAMLRGSVQMGELLVQNGAKVFTGKNKSTPLHAAVSAGFPDCVRFLLENGHQPVPLDKAGFTPLHIAAILENPGPLKMLLEKNVNVAVPSRVGKLLPLHCAAVAGRTENCRLLIEAKAGIEVRDKKDGITPLIGTFFHNHIDTARFLIEAGADIMMRRNDENGITPLVNAVALQRTEMANLICEKAKKDAHKTGTLKKKGGGHRSSAYKKRLFVLYGVYFLYYKTAKQVEPQGIIVLDGAKAQVPPGAKKGEFVVTTSRRNYEIQAASVEERDQWIEAIEKNIAQYGVENPVSPSFNMEGKMPRLVGDDEDD